MNEKKLFVDSKTITKISVKHALYAMMSFCLGSVLTWLMILFSQLPNYDDIEIFVWISYFVAVLLIGLMIFLIMMSEFRTEKNKRE